MVYHASILASPHNELGSRSSERQDLRVATPDAVGTAQSELVVSEMVTKMTSAVIRLAPSAISLECVVILSNISSSSCDFPSMKSSFQVAKFGQRTNFGRFGEGIYTSATSSKARCQLYPGGFRLTLSPSRPMTM